LKDLRGAVQKDLRLFSCSQAASRPTWSAVNEKVSQTRFRTKATSHPSGFKGQTKEYFFSSTSLTPTPTHSNSTTLTCWDHMMDMALSDIRVAPPMRFCQTVPMHPTVMVPAVLRGWGVQDTHPERYCQEV
ncbi:hypothetical protein D4764_15G0010260, partial [Takifugu flavidus]